MRGLAIDPKQRVARVQGGAHLSQLDQQAQAVGLVCPVGVIGHTGVAGLTLGDAYYESKYQSTEGLVIDVGHWRGTSPIDGATVESARA